MTVLQPAFSRVGAVLIRKAAPTGWALLLVGMNACGSGGPAGVSHPEVPCHVAGPSTTASTRTYTMSVVIGAPERMYTPGDAALQHPTEGEVMLRGVMSAAGDSMPGMGSMGDMGGSAAPSGGPGNGPVRHIEVHICSRATGEVISDAQPMLAIIDLTTGSTDDLPVAVMQGVSAGPDDLHYGNNVAFPLGHDLRLRVTLGGEDSQFRLAP